MHLNWLHRASRITRDRKQTETMRWGIPKEGLICMIFPRNQIVTWEEGNCTWEEGREWGGHANPHEGKVSSVKLLITKSSLTRHSCHQRTSPSHAAWLLPLQHQLPKERRHSHFCDLFLYLQRTKKAISSNPPDLFCNFCTLCKRKMWKNGFETKMFYNIFLTLSWNIPIIL